MQVDFCRAENWSCHKLSISHTVTFHTIFGANFRSQKLEKQNYRHKKQFLLTSKFNLQSRGDEETSTPEIHHVCLIKVAQDVLVVLFPVLLFDSRQFYLKRAEILSRENQVQQFKYRKDSDFSLVRNCVTKHSDACSISKTLFTFLPNYFVSHCQIILSIFNYYLDPYREVLIISTYRSDKLPIFMLFFCRSSP